MGYTTVNLIYSIISIYICLAIAQVPQRFSAQNPCTSKSTCQDCIQTPSCAWCYDPEFGGNTRCFQPAFPITPKEQCRDDYVFNPDNVMTVVSNLQLSKAHSKGSSGGYHWGTGYEGSWNASESWESKGSSMYQQGEAGQGSGGQQIVQVAPQRLKLQLRAGQSFSIYMSYTQAEDYPVDLYYLMDLSRSMYDDKEKLSSLGDQLAQTMQNITSNFTLGFGSFVDKVVMPYVSTLPENLLHPCSDCAAPYGYQNMMSLSQNTHLFSRMVKQANVSGNLDAPEGGFDAIMQAVVCRNNIGWRERARRLLVFSTDASFHYAGDGKLGGIVKPNDGACHLSHEGYYSESSYQDYPSIEQINLAVKKNAINVIFAVTGNTIGIYEQLAKHIEGASTAKLEKDSSNIVELIKNQYEQISSSVEMKHNASSAVSIRFFTKCLNATGASVNTNKCGNIKVGDMINFKIDLEVLKCPKLKKDRTQTIQIYPVGINESLIIDLEMLCGCNCEQPGDKFYEENSPVCHNHGTYKCGICECNPGAFGRHCECNADEINNMSLNKTLGCIKPNSTTGAECSGRGTCICGRCDCDSKSPVENIYGDYCECDNFSCERFMGELCSGETHGVCDCGVCKCKPGWTGPNCACEDSTAGCYAPDVIGGEICSGHGTCVCGQCVCENTKESRYSGKFCEKCPTCPDRCLEFRDCVQCQQYHTGPLKDPDVCSANCTNVPVPIAVDKVEAIEENNEYLCHYTDEDHCQFTYVYYYDIERKLHIRAQEERTCPPEVFVLGIVFGVIAAIVLIGMAILLLWKLLTTIHDRREFAKFEKERMMAKWDTGENPIYKQATSTFKNPTYAGKG
ncbi:position-specific antigen beta subunit myospheroid isoform X1 [Rhynchophorus ferrugineus]|uniref:position-specific antigen beta subunit myospheroid isoform X1 n=1 Tax=Rhynchophorus ferrugineus TaxID=354439 RepID=UPI003FCD014F